MEENSFSFSVKGDLNEEELNDLAALYDDLALIADDFYSGDLAGAMEGAMGIGDMGSLSQLSASFSHSERTATRLTSQHVLPPAEELNQGFKDMPGLLDRLAQQQEEPDHNEVLKGQWQQIKDFLDNRQVPAERPARAEAEPADKVPKKSAPQQMMAQLKETISDHPRLSPFALPLAHKAMEQGGEDLRPAERMLQREGLKMDMLAELENWLAA